MVYPYTSFYYRKPIVTPFAMRLNENYVVLEEGESFYLYVVGPKKKAKFSTNDFKVVDVSSGGTISARQKGRAVIKVKVGNKILKCKVKVIKKKK
jgi:6-phosphogluconate dehydrogenase (decarboxylating)